MANGQQPSVVGRAGFEPTKRGARQIYSLLPLTTRPSPPGPGLSPGICPQSGPSVLEPERGLEPLTYRLQIGCAANCATRARVSRTQTRPTQKRSAEADQ